MECIFGGQKIVCRVGSLILPNGYLDRTQALRFGSRVVYLLSHLTGLKIVLQRVQTSDKVISMFKNFSSE